MLNNRLLSLAHQTATASLLPNQKLRAVPGSPLAFLIDQCRPNDATVLSTESLNQTLGLVADRASQTFALSGTPNLTLALEQIEQQYIKPILNQISFARNVVKPIIADMESSVQDLLKMREHSNVALSIRKMGMPDALYGNLGEHIAKFALVKEAQKGPGFKPTFDPNLSRDEFVELCRSNVESVNEALMELATIWHDFGEEGDLFEATYQRVILQPNEQIGDLFTASYANFMMSVVAFVFADNLAKNPISGLKVNNEALATWCNFCRSACARVVQNFKNLILSAENSKQLVHLVDRTKNVIVVYGRVYDEFDSPDRMDIMMGLFHDKSAIQARSVSTINERAEELKKVGQLAAAAMIRTKENLSATYLQDAIQAAIVRLVEETKQSEETSDLRSFIPDNLVAADYRVQAARHLEQRYPGVHLSKTPLLLVLTDVVCELFFKETMAAVIMSRYVQIGLDRPDSSIATVNSLLVIEMLMEWFGNQIELITE